MEVRSGSEARRGTSLLPTGHPLAPLKKQKIKIKKKMKKKGTVFILLRMRRFHNLQEVSRAAAGVRPSWSCGTEKDATRRAFAFRGCALPHRRAARVSGHRLAAPAAV